MSAAGDRPEHGVGHLAAVGDELRLVATAARHAGTAVAGVGGQQFGEDGAAELQQ